MLGQNILVVSLKGDPSLSTHPRNVSKDLSRELFFFGAISSATAGTMVGAANPPGFSFPSTDVFFCLFFNFKAQRQPSK
jgi:hypothetical protein